MHMKVPYPVMKSELDPCSILTGLSTSQSTGCLEVINGNTTWSVFLQFGQLLNIDCSVQSLGQLLHRLHNLGCEVAVNAVKATIESSEDLTDQNLVRREIDRLTQQGLIDRAQANQVSAELTIEALESLLWVKTGSYKWKEEVGLTSHKSTSKLSVAKLIEYYQQRLTIWQKYTNVVQSPYQRPYLTNHRLLEKPVAFGTLSPAALNQIAQLMRGMSLRELAQFLKQDELKMIQLLIPYIRENVICLREPSAPFNNLPYIPEPELEPMLSGEITSSFPSSAMGGQNSGEIETKTYKIACIDDSPAILDEIEKFLSKDSQYSLTKIENAIKASALIFRLKPDLILMDITMPGINGYKLCQLFRGSAAFEKTPIIMVTGNKGLIDKARAKLVGATDYLTKPFTEAELLGLVKKYLI
jgi:two-component system, chemotaxis family, response regulator PixG